MNRRNSSGNHYGSGITIDDDLTDDREVQYSWGNNGSGQLGFGDRISRIRPQSVDTFLSGIRDQPQQIACGSRFSVMVTTAGRVFAWGKNDEGQLGTDDYRLKLRPRWLDTLDGVHITAVATRGSHVLALNTQGHCYTWGRNEEGQLGQGNHIGTSSPQVIQDFVQTCKIVKISCGRHHSVVVNHQGSVFTFGCGDDGQLGRGDTKSLVRPRRVGALDGKQIIDIACGSRHTLAITSTGLLFAWGWGIYGQLGLGNHLNQSTPTLVSAFSGRKVLKVWCGYRHSFALVAHVEAHHGSNDCQYYHNTHHHHHHQGTGTGEDVFGWGWNLYGQLGVMSSTGVRAESTITVPISVPKLQNVEIIALSAGGRHTICTIKRSIKPPSNEATASAEVARKRAETYPFKSKNLTYETLAFGSGHDGQLGLGTLTDHHVPQSITSLMNKKIEMLASGWSHSCAIIREDRLLEVSKHRHGSLSILDATITVPLFTMGDLDGFFGMLLQCMIQLMIIFKQLPLKCGQSLELVTGRIIPAAAATIMLGNIVFGMQSILLAKRERREDVTAQPQGINTVLVFAYMLLVMAPEYQLTGDPVKAWEVGIFAAMVTGILQILMLPMVGSMKKFIPRAALMASTAGIALTFLSMSFAFQVYENPSIAIGPLFLIVICYGAGVKLPFQIPTGLGALLFGTLLAFVLFYAGYPSFFIPFSEVYVFRWEMFYPDFDLVYRAMTSGAGWKYLSVIGPMVLVNFMSDIANIETAATVGDQYDLTFSILGDSLVTIAGAILGNPFPTGIYIGQPVFKAMGARTGYLLMNAVTVFVIALMNGTALILNTVPIASVVGFLLWIGLAITAKAFEPNVRSNTNHSMAVAFGLVPALAAWAWQLIQDVVVAAQTLSTNSSISLIQVINQLTVNGVNPAGIIALSQGYLITSIFLASTLVHIIERQFLQASIWMIIAALLSYGGLVHSFRIERDSILPNFGLLPGGLEGWAMQYGTIYLGVAMMLLLFHVREQEISCRMCIEGFLRMIKRKTSGFWLGCVGCCFCKRRTSNSDDCQGEGLRAVDSPLLLSAVHRSSKKSQHSPA